MRIKETLSKENLVNTSKSIGKLRLKINHSSLITYSALILILFVAFAIRTFPMRWEIETGSIHLTEFDPYFQYRFTEKMVKDGLLSWAFENNGVGWIDTQRWYPDGINVARAGYPGLPLTAAVLYKVILALGINISLMNFAALLPVFLGILACLIIYFLGKDIGGKSIGLLAALFLALSPSFVQRSSIGWFDDEIVGVFSILLLAFFFLRAIEEERSIGSTIKYAIGAGLALGYLCIGWGAAYYAIGLMALFTFVLIFLKRYSQRLFLSYSLTFGLGLFIAISIPKLAPNYLLSSAILPVAAIFILLCLSEVFREVASIKWRIVSVIVFLGSFIGSFAALWMLGYMGSLAGKFISVLDPISRAAEPLIESVAEHRISAWGSIYYEFGIMILFFVVGLYFVLRNPSNKNLFVLIFGLTSLYFACSMVRLFVVMAPAFGLLAATGIVGILRPFNALLKEQPKIIVKKKYALERVSKEFSGVAVFLIFLILMTNFAFPMPKIYKQAYSPTTITASSLSIVPNTPVREWLDMLQYTNNLPQSSTTVVVSWWDYGYWLTILGNVTTLADNATINTTQIQNLGFIFMANETQALKMLKLYNAEYILVFVTFDAYGRWQDGAGGDNGKWMWMARISGQANDRLAKGDTNGDGIVDVPDLIDENSMWVNQTTFGYYNSTQNKWIWNDRGKNSTFYKLVNWGKLQWFEDNDATSYLTQYDPDAAEAEKPTYFDRAYFAGSSQSDATSNYGGLVPLVCLYKINWEQYYKDYPSG